MEQGNQHEFLFMMGLGDLAGAKTTIIAPGMCGFFVLSPDLVSLPPQSVFPLQSALFWGLHLLVSGSTTIFLTPVAVLGVPSLSLFFHPLLSQLCTPSAMTPRQLLFVSSPFGDLSFLLTLLLVCFKQYLDLLSETLNLKAEWWKGFQGKKTNKQNKEDYPEEKFAGRYFKTTIPITLIFPMISPLTLDFKDQICVFHHLP